MTVAASAPAIAFGLGAAAVWGASDFTGGFVTRRTSPAYVVAIAHGLSLGVILIFIAVTRPAWPSPHTLVYGLLSGVAGGLALLIFYEALALGSMGLTAALSGVLTAVLPVIVSFFREGHPSGLKLLGFALGAVAIWLIAYTPGGKPHPRGLGLATVSGLGFGALLVLLRTAAAESVVWALACSRIASTAAALTVSALVAYRAPRSPRAFAGMGAPGRKPLWLPILGFAAIAGALDTTGNLLYMLSSLRGRLDVAAVLSSLYPAITILLAAWLLKERTTRSQAFGMALALAAVLMISL